MNYKKLWGIVVVSLLFALIILNFNFSAFAVDSPTIFIRADGSIDPPTAPLEKNGDLYVLTEDLVTETNCITIERDNTILDGANHKITGTNQNLQRGISLNDVQKVTVQNLEIDSFGIGILLWNASNTTIIQNKIFNNINLGIGFDNHYPDVNQDNRITQNLFSGNYISIGPIGDGTLRNSVLSQNQIVENSNGLSYYGAEEGCGWINVTIVDNLIADNIDIGIYMTGYKAPTFEVTIVNNVLRNNGGSSIFLEHLGEVLILNNTITDNNYGIILNVVSSIKISGNTIEGNGFGLSISGWVGGVARNIMINENIVKSNTEHGIWLYGAAENIVINNVIEHNSKGIIVETQIGEPNRYSNDNLIVCNQIIENTAYGIHAIQCENNLLYQNSFTDNSIQVFSENSNNTWDNGAEIGNFWSDYLGVDADDDGIGDTPYTIDQTNTDNYPLINSWNSQKNKYLVVRGDNDLLYLRKYDSLLNLWAQWISLPGSTCDSPAAAVLNNQIHIVVRGMNGNSLWHGYYDLSNEEFMGWTMLEGSSPSKPVLTSDGVSLCLVVHGTNNQIYYRMYADENWKTWQTIPNSSTKSAPSAVLQNGMLRVVAKDNDGYSMWETIIVPEGVVIQDWKYLAGYSPSAAALTQSQSPGELFLMVQGADNGIYYSEYEDSWSGWTNLQGLTQKSPSITACRDFLHIMVCGFDESTLWEGKINLNTNTFEGWTWLDGSTPSAATLVS